MTRKLQKIFFAISLFTGLFGGELGNAAGFQFGGLREDIQTIVSGAYTAVMSTASTQNINITGTNTATIMQLPSATTLQAGYYYNFFNNGTGPVAINDNAGTQIAFLEPGTWLRAMVTSTTTSGGPWTVEKGGLDNAQCQAPVAGAGNDYAIDWRAGPCFALTLSKNSSIIFTNRPTTQQPRKTIFIRLTNTASNYVVTWQSPNVFWPGGTVPTETTGAKVDAITCDHDPVTNKTLCNSVQNF